MKVLDESFIHDNLMGPNVALMFEELCAKEIPQTPDARICDLGCGAGLSSLLAAQCCSGTVYAVDSWNAPEQNRERFDEFECGGRIEAVQADAPDLPFKPRFFDCLFSLDSYNYFGREEGIIDAIASYVKPGAQLLLAFPGMVRTLDEGMMEVFSKSWTAEQMDYIRTIDWWRGLFEKSDAVRLESIKPMECYRQAWADWLSCDNEYAQGDRAAMEAGGIELMNLIAVKLEAR